MLHVIFHALTVRFKAFHAMHGERPAGVARQKCGIEEVEDHDRFEDVQFEVALRASESNGGVVITQRISCSHPELGLNY
jgi:metal-dependent hydrolase (beta-lactamase superfamily II)